MLNSNIINNITTLYFKNKFNNVLKQVKQVEHDYYSISDYDTRPEGHTITINKKNYDIHFSYNPFWTCKTIKRDENDFFVSADLNNNHPRDWDWHWDFSNNLPDYLYQNLDLDDDTDDINDIKEMERNVINYFNTLKPMVRTFKIKK